MEYVVIDDCGNTGNLTYKTLEEARAARQEIMSRIGAHMGDHMHIARLTYVRNPGAWKVTMDDAEYTKSGENSVLYYQEDEVDTADRMYDMGHLACEPEWVPDYEWSE